MEFVSLSSRDKDRSKKGTAGSHVLEHARTPGMPGIALRFVAGRWSWFESGASALCQARAVLFARPGNASPASRAPPCAADSSIARASKDSASAISDMVSSRFSQDRERT